MLLAYEGTEMSKGKKTAISPTRQENYADWYQEVLKAAELSEHAPVRGCMIIKPWGFALWEKMQKHLDSEFKKEGVQNAYFPLLIPLSFLEKEASHVEGFAKECAVVTHHRLEKKDDSLVPAGKLDEPYVIRPTSEMIVGESFSRWIESYRDLPLKINQWCNVMRWEMRTRMFLRTSEFLWQEGHTAFAAREEAKEDAQKMLSLYKKFLEEILAIPVITGRKSENEKFPGAEITLTMEAMMQDKKALQAGTSHFLGQSFSRSCGIQFQSESGEREYAWTSSWGVTTRLIGALVMVHSDDDGLVLPPKIASVHVVILPITREDEDKEKILSYAEEVAGLLRASSYHGSPIGVQVDRREIRGGEKAWGWIKKGVPIRLEIGKSELLERSVSLKRRDESPKERFSYSEKELSKVIPEVLEAMQTNLWEKAKSFRDGSLVRVSSEKEFITHFKNKDAGFLLCYFDQDSGLEKEIQEKYGVTTRCIPDESENEFGECIFTGKKNCPLFLFAKSY